MHVQLYRQKRQEGLVQLFRYMPHHARDKRFIPLLPDALDMPCHDIRAVVTILDSVEHARRVPLCILGKDGDPKVYRKLHTGQTCDRPLARDINGVCNHAL